MARIITPGQLKAIYALARKAGMTDGDVHALAHNLAGCSSLRQMSGYEAGRMISELKRRLGQTERPRYAADDAEQMPLDRLSAAQKRMIYAIAHDLGWIGEEDDGEGRRLRGWLEKKYGVSTAGFLNARQASACINALAAMRREGRGDRSVEAEDERMDGR